MFVLCGKSFLVILFISRESDSIYLTGNLRILSFILGSFVGRASISIVLCACVGKVKLLLIDLDRFFEPSFLLSSILEFSNFLKWNLYIYINYVKGNISNDNWQIEGFWYGGKHSI